MNATLLIEKIHSLSNGVAGKYVYLENVRKWKPRLMKTKGIQKLVCKIVDVGGNRTCCWCSETPAFIEIYLQTM